MEFIIVAGPVIIENGKVLVNKHGDTDFWKFPGGRVGDFNELDLEKHAKREVKEEMGVEVEVIRPMKTIMSKKDNRVVILVHYLAKRVGEIKPGTDIREWQWLDIHNLPKDIGPNIKPIIEEYLEGESR